MASPTAAVVRLHDAFGLASEKIRTVLTALTQSGLPLEQAFALAPNDLERSAGLAPALATALFAGTAEAAQEKAIALQKRGFRAITLSDSEYPPQLKAHRDCPPILYVRGDPHLLTTQGFAFAGARNVSEAGLEATRALALDTVQHGWQVISGAAPGVDTRAHRTALEANGLTTFVLPEGALKTATRAEIRPAINATPNSALFVSQFPPTMPWAARLAMMRNRTIIGLSRALIVIEAGLESGGTWQAGLDAEKMAVPLYVAAFTRPVPSAAGNAALIAGHGGIPIHEAGGWRLPEPEIAATSFKQLGLFGD